MHRPTCRARQMTMPRYGVPGGVCLRAHLLFVIGHPLLQKCYPLLFQVIGNSWLRRKFTSLPMPPTLGEVASRRDDGEGEPRKDQAYNAVIRSLSGRADIVCTIFGFIVSRCFLLFVSILTLSGVALLRQLSQRESPWQTVAFSMFSPDGSYCRVF